MERRGSCDWQLCPNEADWLLPPGMVKRQDTGGKLGDVYLCEGHFRYVERTGHLHLAWERVLKAAEV